MAILGVVAVIAVVGLVLLFKGGAGKATLGPGPFIEPSPEKACSTVMCENGMGGVVLGEQQRAEGEFWVCGCSEFFADRDIADWSNQWKGDEARVGLDFPNTDRVWLIRKIREY